MNNNYDLIQARREQAIEFEKSGGDIALFWAGQLAVAAQNVINAGSCGVSGYIIWMSFVLEEYNKVIITRAND